MEKTAQNANIFVSFKVTQFYFVYSYYYTKTKAKPTPSVIAMSVVSTAAIHVDIFFIAFIRPSLTSWKYIGTAPHKVVFIIKFTRVLPSFDISTLIEPRIRITCSIGLQRQVGIYFMFVWRKDGTYVSNNRTYNVPCFLNQSKLVDFFKLLCRLSI